MAVIDPSEISPDPVTGLVVLAYAVTVAPTLATNLAEGVQRQQAVAILTKVAADLPGAGMARVSQQSRNGTSVSFREVGSAFSPDDRDALRALYGDPVPASSAAPIGEFPAAGVVASMWPEATS